MSSRIYFNEEWLFTEKFSEEMLFDSFDETTLEKVRLPHTVKVTPYNYFHEMAYQMVSGYRKVFKADKSWEGKHVLLTFEGAAHKAEVYLNGSRIAKHQCGYTAFTVDLEPYLFYEVANILVVKLNSKENLNIPPFGKVIDYMTYGGIYREVYLEIKEPIYIKDAFVTTTGVSESTKQLEVNMLLNEWEEGLSVRQSLMKWEPSCEYMSRQKELNGTKVYGKGNSNEFKVMGHYELIAPSTQFIHYLSDAQNWEIESPYLYVLKLELIKEDKIVDTQFVRFGFREIAFKQDGFYLNGKKLKLRGLNRHQAYPYVGYAMPKGPQINDAKLLKEELGLNVVRTSHYPQSQYFIDCCDEIGLLVVTELPGWQYIGNHKWKEVAYQNIEEMIIQYRNHPSIILWGVRINESEDDDAFYMMTNRIAHKLDTSRPTGGVRCIKNSRLLEDVYTYNDFIHEGNNKGCERKKDVTGKKDIPYLVTEYNGHMYPTKSFDCEVHRLEHALRHARVLNAIGENEDIAGGIGWCMTDYNTHKDFGSGDRICYHGVMDMYRNKKLAAYVYSSQDEREDVLEVSSSMDIGEHAAGQLKEVYIFTNADEVRFYKNNELIKQFKKQDSAFKHLRHGPIKVDDIIGNQLQEKEGYKKYTANQIKKILLKASECGLNHLPWTCKARMFVLSVLIGIEEEEIYNLYGKYIGNWGQRVPIYHFEAIKEGKVVKVVKKYPMSQVQLAVSVDQTVLHEATSYEVASIRIQVTDENGNLLPYYQEALDLKIEGPIEIIGPSVVTLRGGMGGTYIKTVGALGRAKLLIQGEWVEDKMIEFEVI